MSRYSVVPSIALKPNDPLIFGSLDGGSKDLVVVGRLNESGPLHNVVMDVTGETVIAIFGKRGSGKSYTLGVLAEGLCTAATETDIGRCSQRKAAILLDTLNIFWSTANPFTSETDKSQFQREILQLSTWRIRPPELEVSVWVPNGFRSDHTPESFRDFSIPAYELTAEDIADLFDLDLQRDPMGQMLSEVQEKTYVQKRDYSFEDMIDLMNSDPEITEFYAPATLRAARQRLRSIVRNPLFLSANSTPLSDLLIPGHLAVIELGDLPNSMRAVITSVLLRRIQAERSRASDAEKQLLLNTRLSSVERERLTSFLTTAIPPSWVLIDEAQNTLPSNRQVKSSDAVVRFVREGRNFGLSFGFTTQQPSAVDQRILSQADTVICHKLTIASDIIKMRENLKCAEPKEVHVGQQSMDLGSWVRSLERGQAIVTNAEFDRVFAIEIRPRVCPHGGTGFVN
ncbi:ATP-binding protein [Chloroflexota bacterium]